MNVSNELSKTGLAAARLKTKMKEVTASHSGSHLYLPTQPSKSSIITSATSSNCQTRPLDGRANSDGGDHILGKDVSLEENSPEISKQFFKNFMATNFPGYSNSVHDYSHLRSESQASNLSSQPLRIEEPVEHQPRDPGES